MVVGVTLLRKGGGDRSDIMPGVGLVVIISVGGGDFYMFSWRVMARRSS